MVLIVKILTFGRKPCAPTKNLKKLSRGELRSPFNFNIRSPFNFQYPFDF